MFMYFAFFVLSNIVVCIIIDSSHLPFRMSLFMWLLKEDSGSTGEKQIDDSHFSICISKPSICFYPVTPESSSGVTKINNWKETCRLENWGTNCSRTIWTKISFERKTSVLVVYQAFTIEMFERLSNFKFLIWIKIICILKKLVQNYFI